MLQNNQDGVEGHDRYSYKSVANTVILRAKLHKITDLTPTKLQNLMYFIQSLALGYYGVPLFYDYFHKWTYGPVIPALYADLECFGNRPVRKPVLVAFEDEKKANKLIHYFYEIPSSHHEVIDLVDIVMSSRYGRMNAKQLSDLTRETGSPWNKVQNGELIPNELMLEVCDPELNEAYRIKVE